jgi:hypothetical protein
LPGIRQRNKLNSKKDSGQAGMTEFEYLLAGLINVWNKNMHVIYVMNALTKESWRMPGSFCCTYACRQLHFSG